MASRLTSPLCVRLTEDLRVAAHQLASQQGMTLAEWLRDLVYRTVYGTTPDVTEGYYQGRTAGLHVVMAVATRVLDELRDLTPEQAQAFVAETLPGRPGRDSRG